MEAVISVGAGLLAGSVALIGFGFDSLIEVSSGIVLLWRLSHDASLARREQIERTALRLVGASFLLLALWVAFDAVKSLFNREPPQESLIGIAGRAVVSHHASACAGKAACGGTD